MGWPILSLGDVCGFQNGFAFKSKFFTEAGTPILRISNIQSGSIDLSKVAYTDPASYKEDLSRYTVTDGDLLIAMSGATTGKIGINSTGLDFLLNQRVGKFMPSKKLDKQYLYYFLSTKVNEHLEISAGAAQPNLSTEQIKGMKIPLPPIPEQKRIVAILDQAFADIDRAREITERNLRNIRELFESYLQQVFSQPGEGWSIGLWGEVLEVRNGRNQRDVLDEDGQFPIIGSAGNIMGYANDYLCDEGTTIIGRKGTIDKPKFITYKFWNVDTSFGLVAGERLDQKFLFYFCKSLNFYDLNKGTTLPSLVKKDLVKIRMPLPPIPEQKRIVTILDQVFTDSDRARELNEKKLESLNELKKSLLQKAFSGELTGDQPGAAA